MDNDIKIKSAVDGYTKLDLYTKIDKHFINGTCIQYRYNTKFHFWFGKVSYTHSDNILYKPMRYPTKYALLKDMVEWCSKNLPLNLEE